MVLSVARALFRSRVKLSSPTYLVLWTGEEQGTICKSMGRRGMLTTTCKVSGALGRSAKSCGQNRSTSP